MTNTPSPTDEDRELIHRLRYGEGVTSWWELGAQAADRLESLLSDRAKLEEALRTIASDDYEPLGESFTAAAAQIASAVLNRSTDRGDPS